MNLSYNLMTVDDLDSAARRAVMVAILWRGFVVNLLVIVTSALGGFVVGVSFSFIAALAGFVSGPAYKNLVVGLSALTGFGIGLYASWHYIRWLFRVQLGDYRLRLVPAEARHDRITQESTAASS